MRLFARGLLALASLCITARLASASCATDDPDGSKRAAACATADQMCSAQGMGCNSGNHGAYVSCVAHVASMLASGSNPSLPPSCKGAVKKCAAHSTCGKPLAVTCCLSTAKGPKCKIKKDAPSCSAKNGTMGSCASCCDACPPPGSGPSCPTTTTTTTSSTTTTTVVITFDCCAPGGCCLRGGSCVEGANFVQCANQGGGFLGQGQTCSVDLCAAAKCKYTTIGAGTPAAGCPAAECAGAGELLCSKQTCPPAMCPAIGIYDFQYNCPSGGTCSGKVSSDGCGACP